MTIRKDMASEKKPPKLAEASFACNADHRSAKPRDVG
jgi:hypothetical protein